MVNNLQKIGKRIDNLKKVILKENPKDLWVIDQIHPLFFQLIDSNISKEQEQDLISLLDKVLDKYIFRFKSTFEHKSLTSYLVEGLLPEEGKNRVVAVYGGGFKPPTSGHFEVVKQALKENPNIDEFIILIGGKERDGISPEESLLIWDIYKQYLPIKIRIELSPKPPIQAIYNYAKNHTEETVLWIIGAREGNDDDFKDISSRTTSLDKYPNMDLRVIVTQGGVSGTAARNAAKISQEKLKPMLPSELSDEEVEEVYNIISDKITEGSINEIEQQELKYWALHFDLYQALTTGTSYKELLQKTPTPDRKEALDYFNDFIQTSGPLKGSLTENARELASSLNEISLPKATQQIFKLNPDVDAEEVAKDFIRLSPSLDKKDLFQYSTYDELEQELNKASQSKSQRRKQAKSMDLEDNKFIFYKDDNFTIYKLDNPSQHPESCEIAQGAKICVASNSKKYWNQYMVDGDGVLFYIRNKKYDVPHPESVIAFMFPRKGLKMGYTEMVDYNDDDFIEHGNYKEQKGYLSSIGIPSSIIEKMFKFVPKLKPLSHYIEQYKGKKQKIKVEGKEYFIFSPQAPPGMETIVFEDENGKIIGDMKGNEMWAFIKLNPLERKWIKNKFPNIPESPIGIRTKTNRYFDENAREIDLYTIQNDKLIKTGEASLPYNNDQLKILLSGGTLEIPEKFKNSYSLNENASYSENINLKREIAKLTKHMIDKGMNIQPLPKLVFKNGDSENAKQFLGKTAYYDPNSQSIVLYTEGRHPKDIVRSFSHEMVHHTQFLEDRLGDISTTNTMEDDNIDKLEQEANLKGTMTFRNWTDSLNENKIKDPFGLNSYARELAMGLEENIKISPFSKTTEEYILSDIKEYGDILEFKIDLTDTYQYSFDSNIWEFYDEVNNVKIVVNLKLTSQNIPEFKFYSLQEGKHLSFNRLKHYNPKVMNTIFKIFMDEVLPKNPKILIQPFDYIRYRLFRVMLNNNLDGNQYKIDTKDDPMGQSLILIQSKKNNIKEVMNKKEYQIFCDMDGCLVDFERGYEELTGIYLRGEFQKGDDFWDPISKAGVGFWAGLKWMPDGQKLWDYIKQYKPNLLSAPSREESSRIGKHVWVKNKIPGTKLILRYAKQKKELATPTSILIDDRIENINDWESAGGIGILHTSTANTISQLKKLKL